MNSEINYKSYALHNNLILTSGCIDILCEEWGRSRTAREIMLEKSRDSMPYNLVLVERVSINGNKDIIKSMPQSLVVGHSKLSAVIDKINSALVESVVIKKSHRGKGLGKKLMRETEENAIKLGIDTLYLTTEDKKDFYIRLGYVPCHPVISLGNASIILSADQIRNLFGKQPSPNQTRLDSNMSSTISESDTKENKREICSKILTIIPQMLPPKISPKITPMIHSMIPPQVYSIKNYSQNIDLINNSANTHKWTFTNAKNIKPIIDSNSDKWTSTNINCNTPVNDSSPDKLIFNNITLSNKPALTTCSSNNRILYANKSKAMISISDDSKSCIAQIPRTPFLSLLTLPLNSSNRINSKNKLLPPPPPVPLFNNIPASNEKNKDRLIMSGSDIRRIEVVWMKKEIKRII